MDPTLDTVPHIKGLEILKRIQERVESANSRLNTDGVLLPDIEGVSKLSKLRSTEGLPEATKLSKTKEGLSTIIEKRGLTQASIRNITTSNSTGSIIVLKIG